jgi:pyridoxal phosphate enzyme (YggS family)
VGGPGASASWRGFAVSSLRNRLEVVRRRVEVAAERARRDPADVRIVAVSKTVTAEVVAEAYRLGQTDFGENRVQELCDKRAALDSEVKATWHMIGHLQSNKAKSAAELSDIIQSVGSLKLAQVLDSRSRELGKRLAVLLQVDFSADPGRSGFALDELDSVAADLVALPNLDVQGLMTVAPRGLDSDDVRRVFRSLSSERAQLAARYPLVKWRHLSMGMSDDFELAIEEGATIVRIGRAIFGERSHILGE